MDEFPTARLGKIGFSLSFLPWAVFLYIAFALPGSFLSLLPQPG